MDLSEWLLFLHVLAAFAAVGSIVVFGVMLAAEAPGVLTVGRRLWDVGGAGTLVLGVALAIDIDGYKLWDGWILAPFVLWGVAGFAGVRIGMAYDAVGDGDGAPEDRGGVGFMYGLMAVAVAALLIVMVYKPGA